MFIVHCFYLLVVILLSFLEKNRLIGINMFLSSTNNLSPLQSDVCKLFSCNSKLIYALLALK